MKSKKEYFVTVEYDFDFEDYRAKEDRLEKSVGRESSGSGTGFGVRDVSWCFKTYPATRKAAIKLKRFKFVNYVAIDTWNSKIDGYEDNGQIFKNSKEVVK